MISKQTRLQFERDAIVNRLASWLKIKSAELHDKGAVADDTEQHIAALEKDLDFIDSQIGNM